MVLCAIFVLLCIVAPHPARAAPTDSYTVHHYGAADGLGHSTVWDIMQDSRGLMWFATRNGLSRFDGHDFHTIRHAPFDTTSPSGAGIEGIAEDSAGFVWIASGKLDIDRMDPRSGRCRRFSSFLTDTQSLREGSLNSMICDSRGWMWFCSRSGLEFYDPGQDRFGLVDLPPMAGDRVSAPRVTSVRTCADGSIVFTSGRHVLRRRINGEIDVRGSLPDWDPLCLGEDSQGRLLLARPNSRLVPGDALALLLDTASGATQPVFAADYGDLPPIMRDTCNIQVFGMEADGSLWAFADRRHGAGEGIILRFNAPAGGISEIVRPGSNHYSGVLAYYCSPEGIVWLGMRSGVFKLVPRPRQFAAYRHSDDPASLSNEIIRSLYFCPGDTLWAGTENGLNVLAPGGTTWRRLYAKESPRSNIINEICRLPDGEMLLATNNDIRRVDRSSGSLVPPGFSLGFQDSIPMYGFWTLLPQPDGSLWAGTRSQGLIIYDARRRIREIVNTTNRAPDEFTGGHIWQALRDSHGESWVATSQGLNRLRPDGRSFYTYRSDGRTPGSISANNVCALFEDRGGTLWAATYGGGLNRYDRERNRFQVYTRRDGLPDNVVYGILQAADGDYWCSTDRGLFSFCDSDGAMRVFRDRADLQDNEFSFKAFAASPSGRLAFGGVNGLNVFHPQDIDHNPQPPRLVITGFYQMDSLAALSLGDGDTISVPYDRNFVSFAFAALDYANPAQNRYAYQLQGVNSGWVRNGHRRLAVFTDLAPGDYLFRVRGSNRDGIWNDAGLALTLRILPPFWQTAWFRVTVALCILGLITAAILLWLRRNLLQRRLLEYRLQTLRLQMNPHFIFNALSSIEHLVLTNDTARASRYLTRFSRLMRGFLESGRSQANLLADELHGLRLYLELESLRFKGRFSYAIEVDPALDCDSLRIPPLLIQPYVENALRHGRIHKQVNGCVTITLFRQDDSIACRIEDNGVGRSRSRATQARNPWPSRGMSVTGERLKLLNSTRRRHVSSTVTDLFAADGTAAGTRVELWIPIEQQPAKSRAPELART